MSTTFDEILNHWRATPIVIQDNPALPGRKYGDDSGYRGVPTLKVNAAPFTSPDILTLPDYEGFCVHSGLQNRRKLGGGLKNGVFVLREAAARSVTLADTTLRRLSGDQYSFVGLDAYRSGLRQQLGYSEKLLEQMNMIGLTVDEVNAGQRITEFIGCSVRADGVFSWVKVAQDDVYEALVAELRDIPAILQGATDHARESMKGGATEGNIADAVYEYVIACRNAGIGLAANRGTLVSENNAHAGGGAVDLMIMVNGKLSAITPFDFPGAMSAYDFLETNEHFNLYCAELAKNEVLQDHLRKCGLAPTDFRFEQWEELRAVKRVQYHLGRASGWTFYSMDKHGGEHWHEEPGNIVVDPLTGQKVWEESQTSQRYPNHGNPGHTMQLKGLKARAVWGGATALTVVTKAYGFES